jgi:hypothetical protein
MIKHTLKCENLNHITKNHTINEKLEILDKENKSSNKSDQNYKKMLQDIISYCLNEKDIVASIYLLIFDDKLSNTIKFDLCYTFSKEIISIDLAQAIGFVNNARFFLEENDKKEEKKQYIKLIELAMDLKASSLSLELMMEYHQKNTLFRESTTNGLHKEYTRIATIDKNKREHGHNLLINYIEKYIPENTISDKILIEIGTTRENIPMQGSTMEIARLCNKKNISFTTVDMDKNNTTWAKAISSISHLELTATTEKGEEFLQNSIDEFDFIFLDAYDFDHGKHSLTRQKKYMQTLGAKINEEDCHLMHLKCAKSIVTKLRKDGVVCIDDTWKDKEGNWVAKGTLAVPYLLKNNFKIIEEKNRAVLLKRID